MRYPAGHKEAIRTSIVKKAATALRRDGLAGISIPALMKKAGLTHGGFYAHFKSRDELVAAAVLCAADETGTSVLGEDRDLQAALDAYVSKEHVDHPERGCVLAALGSEGRRQKAPVHRAFAHVARGFIRLIADKVQATSARGEPSDDSLRIAAQMVGAVVLARLVDEEHLATRILRAAKATR